uniref:Uncharacterized protein n=1 Tax=Paramoeba aestuarina TaxID=180227 RepID=A0A7S4KG86_9EUKA|mmetsp:Transcript_18186/g.28494  ORF Transcript_18186/g.28494 Transcript_18186/m.28494 type:complete len:105 (+) Transcript_18186:157-471(+)
MLKILVKVNTVATILCCPVVSNFSWLFVVSVESVDRGVDLVAVERLLGNREFETGVSPTSLLIGDGVKAKLAVVGMHKYHRKGEKQDEREGLHVEEKTSFTAKQ